MFKEFIVIRQVQGKAVGLTYVLTAEKERTEAGRSTHRYRDALRKDLSENLTLDDSL